jgi:hypothetical protein
MLSASTLNTLRDSANVGTSVGVTTSSVLIKTLMSISALMSRD